jgi:hypothetical protein
MRACVSVIGPPGTADTLLRAAAGVEGWLQWLTVEGLRFFSGRCPAAGRMPGRAEAHAQGALLLGPAPRQKARTALSGGRPRTSATRWGVQAAPQAQQAPPTPKRRNDLTHSGQKARWPAVGVSFLLPAAFRCTRIAVPCILILLGGEHMTTADCSTGYPTQLSG